MVGKVSLSLLLLGSLSCFGQVVTSGGYATNGPLIVPFSAASAPLISTPDVALPGSGPAVGVPLTGNTNDPRSSNAPSVADHNGFGPIVPENNAEATGTNLTGSQNPETTAATNSAAEPFEFGIQHFESGASGPANPAPRSLGDIARLYRGQHPGVKVFNNDSIAQLNRAGVQTGNLGAGTVASNGAGGANSVPTPQSVNALVAENRPPALPQSDQETPSNQPARQAGPTASQQRHTAAQPAAAPSQNVTTQQQSSASNQTAASQNTSKSGKLPQTGSMLPLYLVIGALGVGGGTLYLLRR